MSLSLVQSRALLGLEAASVTVEVHLANGLPSFTLVGLADVEVKEARERVRSAIQNAGLEFPNNKKITVNLAPADLPKDSGRFDLPIALGILAASGQIEATRLAGHEFARRVVAVRANCGPCAARWRWRWRLHHRRRRRRGWCCRPDSAQEAALVPGAEVYGAVHLLDVVRQFLPAGSSAALEEATGEGWARVLPRPAGTAAAACRSGRRERPRGRQARARDRGRRRPQPVDGRPARLRQIDAGAALCRLAAGDERR